MERRTFLGALLGAVSSFVFQSPPRKMARIVYQGATRPFTIESHFSQVKVLGGSGQQYSTIQEALDGELKAGKNVRLILLGDIREDVDLGRFDFGSDSLVISPGEPHA